MELFEGRVVRILEDDNKGIKHQRFIIEMNSGKTLLIAHNIDVAPRIEGLYKGAHVKVYGQHEWNELGGLVHWTHHDPDTDKEGGWIEFKNRRIE